MNSKKYNDKENKIMANEDINMKDKPKSKEIEKILENKDKINYMMKKNAMRKMILQKTLIIILMNITHLTKLLKI